MMADGSQSAKGKDVVVDGEPDSSSLSNCGGGERFSAEPSHRWHRLPPASYRSTGGGSGASMEPFFNSYDDGYVSYGAAGSSWFCGGGAGAVGWDAAAGTSTSGSSGSYGGSNGGARYAGASGAVGWDAASGSGTSGGGGSYGGSKGGAGYGGPGDRLGGGDYGMGFLPENHGGSGSASLPSYAPQHHAAGPGSYWPAVNGGGTASSFSSPFIGAGGVPVPQHARTGNGCQTGAGSSAGHEFFHRGNSNGGGGGTTYPSPRMGDATYAPYHHHRERPRSPSPLQRSRWELVDIFVARSLRSLTISDSSRGDGSGGGGGSLGELGRRRVSDWVSRGVSTAAAADPYAGKRLEDARAGTMGSVARTLHGCQFLVRMVAEGGAAAARRVFDGVAGEIVRLMSHTVAHPLVEALVERCTDEQVARVLRILAAAPTDQIVAVARNHAGSNILQTLIGRIAENPEHAELFASTLARVGEHGLLSLVETMDGSRLIIRCLDTFSAYQLNRFIFVVVAGSLHRVCRDKHGCHVMSRCIDSAAAAGDAPLWKSLVVAVCGDGLALAEHGYGNYVVQHVLVSVPEAREWLHASFRGRYVSLARQKASSHVVQKCLELLSPEQADEIVGELLGCRRWDDCTFQELITDRYANYVLQTAMGRRDIQMHNMLLQAVSDHRNLLQDDRIAREVFRTLRRSYP